VKPTAVTKVSSRFWRQVARIFIINFQPFFQPAAQRTGSFSLALRHPKTSEQTAFLF
jgi:hypothetical protein